MEVLRGQVVSNVDTEERGTLLVKFPAIGTAPRQVTYTSPYFKVNGGGFLGIPETGDDILAFHNVNPLEDETEFYYISTIVSKKELSASDENPKFNTIPANDVSPYSKGKPVGQRLTNQTGAGLYIQRNFTASKISNNVTLHAETGEEVNVGSIGVQISNPDGDSIVLTGPESTEFHSARSLYVNTYGPQEFKCLTGDINMRIDNGGDINIENNSWGLNGVPPWSGNIRLKSRWKDITLAALNDVPGTSKIHIVTGGPTGAKITVSNDGNIEIFAQGVPTPNGAPLLPALNITSVGDINMKAGGSINMDAGLGLNINTQGQAVIASQAGTSINSGGIIANNGATVAINGLPMQTINPTGGDVSIVVPVTPLPIPPVPFVPPTNVPGAGAPIPNAYGDGIPGADGGAV